MEGEREVLEDGYDAVVVGSGYGGSVAACRMAMAGLRVCLVEKGRKWEARDFPTNCLQMLSSVRMDLTNWGLSFGKRDALFQIHIHEDSLAGVACGLGGGSLVNAGVIASTPIRARKSPNWPKEWEKDWAMSEASALAILRPESAPLEFSNGRVMREVAEEIEVSSPNPVKLTINFGSGKEAASGESQQLSNCLACGNCMSGCPYNAKKSLDKSYLALAMEAGCTIRTGRQVKYVVENPDEEREEHGTVSKREQRRWRVHFDNFEYISTDFVVLSGTTEILFQSERRGLRLSEKLGFGFSCNGNNVAYVTGCSAPLNAYGLSQKSFSKVPFQDRPGPAITSSYTSSLGFTIQSGVLPTAYPYLIFKGISTYGWPSGYWFLHGVIDKLKHLMGSKSCQGMVLNAIGHDECDGRIMLDKSTDKIRFTPPRDALLAKKVHVFQKLTKRLGGILFISRFRSTSVHLLGGCTAASSPSNGVCNPDGQVFDPCGPTPSVHRGLYVCDASLIPCSIGINPCLTIATVAEHVSRHLVEEVIKYKSSKFPIEVLIERLRTRFDQAGSEFVDRLVDSKPVARNLDSTLKTPTRAPSITSDEIVTITEIMKGYVAGMPCTAYFVMKMNSGNQRVCKNECSSVDSHSVLNGKVGGYVILRGVEKDKLYILDGKVNMCSTDCRTPYTQFMDYHLQLASASGSRYILEGRKVMNPYLMGLYAWKESTTLHVTLRSVYPKDQSEIKQQRDRSKCEIDLKGELYVSPFELARSLISLRGTNGGKFVCALLRSLLRTYLLQTPRSIHRTFDHCDVIDMPYPTFIFHEIKTEDGAIISCKQWESNGNKWKLDGQNQPHAVLLLNGHSTESFCLPTEPKDLVRTLLSEGYEVWLLQSRLHPLHPSYDCTIEDIGKFDIPAAIKKIQQLHGPSSKVHIVAHCVGGLAAHMALMGGHVSASNVASLSCTNSSMFFKVTPSSLFKMRLPLIPVTMKILGQHTILPMLETSKTGLRHQLIRMIARLIPRCERCTCDECEVFSGIFGNGFLHSNISQKLHYWLNKVSLPKLPMSAFPHLRKICLSGFIVDSRGNNSYLIHPERIAVHTLYISGGKSILVTPQTSFLAHRYMKLHHPGFRHERVVVEGFGHSDLLIGEESYERIFPHILFHIKATERGSNGDVEDRSGGRESLYWAKSDDECGTFGACSSWLFVLFLFLFLVRLGMWM